MFSAQLDGLHLSPDRRMRPVRHLSCHAASLAATTIGGIAHAQTVATPSAHFGADAYPQITPTVFVGLNFDRFTRFGKDTTAAGLYTWAPYNDIGQTVGLNAVVYSQTFRSPRSPTLLYRVALQAGPGGNKPTKEVQNWLHDRMGLLYVPDSAIRRAFDVGVSLDATTWRRFGGSLWVPPAFAGGGLAVSTIHQEAFLQAGVRSQLDHRRPLGLSLMLRGAVVGGGNAFPDATLERAYASAQGSVQFGLWQLLDTLATHGPRWTRVVAAIFPDLEAVYSTDTGFFRAHDGTPLPERFIGGRLSWLGDLVQFETWNDTVNDKDIGPTGGGRVFVRLTGSGLFDRIGWWP
jgi:hypothetical protein